MRGRVSISLGTAAVMFGLDALRGACSTIGQRCPSIELGLGAFSGSRAAIGRSRVPVVIGLPALLCSGIPVRQGGFSIEFRVAAFARARHPVLGRSPSVGGSFPPREHCTDLGVRRHQRMRVCFGLLSGLVPLVSRAVLLLADLIPLVAGPIPFVTGLVSPFARQVPLIAGFIALLGCPVPLIGILVPPVPHQVPQVPGVVSLAAGVVPLVTSLVPRGTRPVPLITRLVTVLR